MEMIYMINQLIIKSKSIMKVERLQQEKEMITQLVFGRLSILTYKDHYQLNAVDLSKKEN